MKNIPKQVEDDATEAEELFAQMYPKSADEQDDAPETDEEEEEEPDTDKEPAGEGEEEEEDDDPAGDDPDTDEEPSYRDRYNTLKGKYDNEVPRLQKDLSELKKRVFDRLGDVTKEPETPAVADKMDEVRARIEARREEYDPDMISLIEDIFQLNVSTALESSVKPVAEKVSNIEKGQEETLRETVAQTIDSQVEGDWRKLMNGEDQGFLEFLEQEDPSGMFTYGEALSNANSKWHANRMARIFKIYLQEGDTAPAADEEDPAEAEKAPAQKKKNKARVAPSRTQTTTTPVGEDKIIWTQASIAQFEKDERSGKYKNNPEELDRLWNDLLLAVSEKRIRD